MSSNAEEKKAARDYLGRGKQTPYGGQPAEDWADAAALGVMANLLDRLPLKQILETVPDIVRGEMVESLAAIIRTAHKAYR